MSEPLQVRPRHVEGRGLRPLDRLGSIKIKLGVLVTATVSAACFLTWLGMKSDWSLLQTFPVVLVASLVFTQVLAHGMIEPLRLMKDASTAMAEGDYSRRVPSTSRDEVGALADAFNHMAWDLQREDEARRAVVANVSHELRTPVAALRAQLENMADGVVAPSSEELNSALCRTEQLSELISFLLDLSRVDAGAADLNVAPLSLNDLLNNAVDIARRASDSAGRDVSWDVSVAENPLTIEGDEARLRQVFLNVLDNAARHTKAGSTVHVTARRVSGRQGVVIDITDHGPGISPDERHHIFSRFQRGASADPSGTGLGLSIARWAVGLHGGTIAAIDPPADHPNSGATIRVRLPSSPEGRQRRTTVLRRPGT
ncbi:HAMP domain-containing sensor histidine kinase [Actinomyces vulturis]|uniref:HAMP domain-containing sensor histidine kinase n=1 Tax=Actinomyces vulturis TaxID=1857645 RepID=UPI000833FE61|nr:ATP-binding protein [Actinomyces vulturis]